MLTRRFSIQSLLSMIFFATLWGILWWQLSGEWSVNDQYSYGWFVPLFAVVLFWLRFEDVNLTAGGREPFANRPREAGDSALVKAERWEDAPKARGVRGQRTQDRDQSSAVRRQRSAVREQITENTARWVAAG